MVEKRHLACLALVLLLASCGSPDTSAGSAGASVTPPPSPTTFTAVGTVTVPASEFSQENSDDPDTADVCLTDGGYGDISPKSQVVVADATGKTLAVGELGYATFEDPDVRFRCVFPLTVEDVPEGEQFYAVRVGGASRGSVTLRRDGMTSIALKIGD